MSKTFCAVPWIQLSTRPDGNIRICCLMTNSSDPDKGTLRKESGSFFKAGEGDIDLAMNAAKIKKLRQELLDGKQSSLCGTCWEKESLGMSSKRLITNKKFFSSIDVTKAGKITSEDGEITHFIPRYLDIRLGNQCNLKCIMCHPGSSSKWYSDYRKIFGKDHFFSNHQKISLVKKEETDPFDWYKDQRFWDYIDKHIHEVQQVYLVGGEPMILTEHERFLQHCVRSGFASNIDLEYDTNLTHLNNSIIDLWKKFRKITLRVSIDSVGEPNNYIRYPSSWDSIEENLNVIQKMKANVHWGITATWQIYNLISVLDILYKFPGKSHIRILSSPKFLDVKILPKKLKEYAIIQFKNNLKRSSEQKKINSLIAYLENNLFEENRQKLKEFASFTQKADELRSLSFKKTFPDVYDYLESYF